MARTKTTPNPPPKVDYKAQYPWSSDELLAECTSLTTVEDMVKHQGDPHLYNFNAFCSTHDSHISVCHGTPGEPLCVDNQFNGRKPFIFTYQAVSSALVCAFPSRPLRGSYSPRLTQPLPSYIPTAGPMSGLFKFYVGTWASHLQWTFSFISLK